MEAIEGVLPHRAASSVDHELDLIEHEAASLVIPVDTELVLVA